MPALRPSSAKPVERRITTYDLEWYPHSLELRMVGVYDERGFRWYSTITDFVNRELTSTNGGRWFYAHAGGLFDIQFVWEYLINHPEKGFEIEAVFSGSSAIIVTLRKGGKVWKFLDSFWLIRSSLAKIGEWIGIKKGGNQEKRKEVCKYPEEVCTCDPIFFAPMSELVDYNRDDVIILYEAIKFFERVLIKLGGQLEVTVASSAIGLFRKAFLTREIVTQNLENDTFRASYIGSRVEVFSRKCENANYYDINSSFPYSMTFSVPGNMTDIRATGFPSKGHYVARVKITVPDDMRIPPIPYRHVKERRIYFPTGSWTALLTKVDIELALDSGCDIDYAGEIYCFEDFNDLSEYAIQIYELRKNAKTDGEKQVLKILLNSLYGKFGERGEKTKVHVFPKTISSDWVMLRPGIWEEKIVKIVPHCHVPIASTITARSRRFLWEYMSKSESTYYCDTDGFACGINDTFDTSNELGGLKLEKVIQEGEFLAPKLYAMKQDGTWDVKAKGFPRLNYEKFCELKEGLPIKIYGRFSRIKENLNRGDIAPKESIVTKQLRNVLRPKRAFKSDGSSRPWMVSELQEKG